MIGKTVDVAVTSVLQTTAGKMIFGKFDERGAAAVQPPRPAAPEPHRKPGMTPVPTSSPVGGPAPNGMTERSGE
jgi:hypothetical protein